MELYSKSFPIYEQRLPEMRGRGYGAQTLSFSASAKDGHSRNRPA